MMDKYSDEQKGRYEVEMMVELMGKLKVDTKEKNWEVMKVEMMAK
jgi:hypothetical protein